MYLCFSEGNVSGQLDQNLCFSALFYIYLPLYDILFRDIDDFFVCKVCSKIFIRTILFLLVIWLFDYYLFILLYLWKVCYIFGVRYVWQLDSFVMPIYIYWIVLLLSSCNRRWWISINLFLERNFDLEDEIMWNDLISS